MEFNLDNLLGVIILAYILGTLFFVVGEYYAQVATNIQTDSQND